LRCRGTKTDGTIRKRIHLRGFPLFRSKGFSQPLECAIQRSQVSSRNAVGTESACRLATRHSMRPDGRHNRHRRHVHDPNVTVVTIVTQEFEGAYTAARTGEQSSLGKNTRRMKWVSAFRQRNAASDMSDELNNQRCDVSFSRAVISITRR
jgi:hypothetical protein